MRIFIAATIVVALALLAGCGDSDEGTSPSDGGHPSTREVRTDFEAEPGCKRPPGASRWGCSIGSLRCQAVVTDRGWSVSCSEPGRSVAFLVRR